MLTIKSVSHFVVLIVSNYGHGSDLDRATAYGAVLRIRCDVLVHLLVHVGQSTDSGPEGRRFAMIYGSV